VLTDFARQINVTWDIQISQEEHEACAAVRVKVKHKTFERRRVRNIPVDGGQADSDEGKREVRGHKMLMLTSEPRHVISSGLLDREKKKKEGSVARDFFFDLLQRQGGCI
jgi:hypothetical protein